jgi:hypothetical protein
LTSGIQPSDVHFRWIATTKWIKRMLIGKRPQTFAAALPIAAIIGATVSFCGWTTPAGAAESAAGAYILGIRGPGAGVMPPEGLFFSNQVYSYRGRISGRVSVDGNLLTGAAKVRPLVNIPTLLWITPLRIGDAQFGLSLTAPYGKVSVSGALGPILRRDTTTTFADPSVGALLGGKSGDLHWQVGAAVFLPIGDYRKGDLANVSKNRGALDVYGALTWIEPASGLDITNVVGVTFNRANKATDYRTGNEFHWEWAVTKKFDNGFSIGPAGYYYQQFTGDTGRGALLGDFKGRTAAVGGTVGYEFKVGRVPVATRLRVYREFDVERRFQGTAAFFSVLFPLWVPGAN